MNAEQAAKVIYASIKEQSRSLPPEQFMAFFCGGIISNVVGNLPDEFWRKATKIEICSNPGCNCHELRTRMIETLDFARDDYRKTFEEKRKEAR
jgi:hypothetical protein